MNAIPLINTTKNQLKKLGDEGEKNHLANINLYCTKYDIDVLKLDEKYVAPTGYRRNQVQEINDHHF